MSEVRWWSGRVNFLGGKFDVAVLIELGEGFGRVLDFLGGEFAIFVGIKYAK